MIRTHIRGIVQETKKELVFYDGNEKKVTIKNPTIVELRAGEERPYTAGLNEFDVIDYDPKTGRVVRDAEATNRRANFFADLFFDDH